MKSILLAVILLIAANMSVWAETQTDPHHPGQSTSSPPASAAPTPAMDSEENKARTQGTGRDLLREMESMSPSHDHGTCCTLKKPAQ